MPARGHEAKSTGQALSNSIKRKRITMKDNDIEKPYPIQRIDGDLYLIAPSGRRVYLRPVPEQTEEETKS